MQLTPAEPVSINSCRCGSMSQAFLLVRAIVVALLERALCLTAAGQIGLLCVVGRLRLGTQTEGVSLHMLWPGGIEMKIVFPM